MSDEKKKMTEGNCAICGRFGKLSFEHVPPQSAFNDRPIFVQNHTHLTDENSPLHGKKAKSNKGFGGYTLCISCNNLTGDWYARDFGTFAHQGMAIISNIQEPQYYITGEYFIKPLNVIKQIMTMFMSADKSGILQSQSDLVRLLLDRESNLWPERYKIFLYSNLSSVKRLWGYSVVFDEELGMQKWSEINFRPFGYLLADESIAAHEDMLDITYFSRYEYNQDATLILRTPYLPVSSPELGRYG
ncbi:hypothetical protein IC229_32815 [Spirosoma sp. BT702]|uniref:Uncharacterized protein n=1 Tax=Spirosoma profusum TaxID=2771354 RepID=A0A927AW37_9BACT|nr:hypothetical protein [Spirosoma profusum]MBD2705439.1 hypothetical protein [Spirosoma profusum]